MRSFVDALSIQGPSITPRIALVFFVRFCKSMISAEVFSSAHENVAVFLSVEHSFEIGGLRIIDGPRWKSWVLVCVEGCPLPGGRSAPAEWKSHPAHKSGWDPLEGACHGAAG